VAHLTLPLPIMTKTTVMVRRHGEAESFGTSAKPKLASPIGSTHHATTALPLPSDRARAPGPVGPGVRPPGKVKKPRPLLLKTKE
jgi:hypothetical protein